MFGLPSLARTLPAALRDVSHAKARVRQDAVRDLSRLAAAEGAAREAAIGGLCAVLTDDPDPAVRGAAALGLADADAVERLPLLLAALEDAQLEVRKLAMLAIGELGSARGQGAGAWAPSGSEPATSLQALASAIEPWLTSREPALRYQALLAYRQLVPQQASAPVRRCLSDPDPELRYLAVRLYEELGDAGELEMASDVLRERLSDEDTAVSLAAAIALGRRGDTSGAEQLLAAVQGRPRPRDPEDEQAAIELCGRLLLREATAGLRRRAHGLLGVGLGRDRFEYQARVALAQFGDERARREILSGLKARLRDDRTVAVAAAGEARLREALPLLHAMVDDPTRAEPEAVAAALASIREPDA